MVPTSPLSQVGEGPQNRFKGLEAHSWGPGFQTAARPRSQARVGQSESGGLTWGLLTWQPQVEVNRLSRAGGALGTGAWEGAGPWAGGLESAGSPPQR